MGNKDINSCCEDNGLWPISIILLVIGTFVVMRSIIKDEIIFFFVGFSMVILAATITNINNNKQK